MNRVERLVNLVAALLDARRPLSRAEIVQHVPGYEGEPASVRRAFERDKETLRDMGIPLVIEALDRGHPELGDGYRIPREDYQLPDPGLSSEELAALQLAATTMRLQEGGATAAHALWKLGGTARPPADAPVADLSGNEHVVTLFTAVASRRQVRFGYRGEQRDVDPHRLSFASGRWYLDGFDHGRGGERQFRVDRMESPPDLGGPATTERPESAGRAPGAAQPWRLGDEEEVEALMRVDASQAGWVVGRADAVRDQDADGGVVVALRVTNREAFRSFVLGFLDHAEVLGPPELRNDMVAWLHSMAQT